MPRRWAVKNSVRTRADCRIILCEQCRAGIVSIYVLKSLKRLKIIPSDDPMSCYSGNCEIVVMQKIYIIFSIIFIESDLEDITG